MTPRLSVGIPVYNQAATIEETIRSLLNQSVQPFEIVIAENHSNDGTAEIAARYRDRIRIVRPPQHLSNHIVNFNFLAEQCRGEWFAIVCGDDIALPNFVTTLQKGIARSDDAVLVRAGWQYIDGAGKPGAKKLLLSVGRREIPPETLYKSITGCKGAFPSFAFKRAAWQTAGGIPDYIEYMTDWVVELQLAPFGAFIYEPKIIGRLRHYNYLRPGHADFIAKAMMRDIISVGSRVIPAVAARTPGADMEVVARGKTEVFRCAVRHAVAHVAATDRAAVAESLRQIAETDAELALIARFERGEGFDEPRFDRTLRRIVRGPMQFAASLAARISDSLSGDS